MPKIKAQLTGLVILFTVSVLFIFPLARLVAALRGNVLVGFDVIMSTIAVVYFLWLAWAEVRPFLWKGEPLTQIRWMAGTFLLPWLVPYFTVSLGNLKEDAIATSLMLVVMSYAIGTYIFSPRWPLDYVAAIWDEMVYVIGGIYKLIFGSGTKKPDKKERPEKVEQPSPGNARGTTDVYPFEKRSEPVTPVMPAAWAAKSKSSDVNGQRTPQVVPNSPFIATPKPENGKPSDASMGFNPPLMPKYNGNPEALAPVKLISPATDGAGGAATLVGKGKLQPVADNADKPATPKPVHAPTVEPFSKGVTEVAVKPVATDSSAEPVVPVGTGYEPDQLEELLEQVNSLGSDGDEKVLRGDEIFVDDRDEADDAEFFGKQLNRFQQGFINPFVFTHQKRLGLNAKELRDKARSNPADAYSQFKEILARAEVDDSLRFAFNEMIVKRQV